MNNIRKEMYRDFSLAAKYIFGIDDPEKKTNKQPYPEARYAIWYAMTENKEVISYAADLEQFTIRERTSIFVGIRKCKQLMEIDPVYKEKVERVINLDYTEHLDEMYNYHLKMARHFGRMKTVETIKSK